MPIISKIGRQDPFVRALIFSIYAVLVLGALSMLYPFLLMIAGSTKSALDTPDTRLIPAYLTHKDALYQKHIQGLFNESLQQMQIAYDSDALSFRDLDRPGDSRAPLVPEWLDFLESHPPPPYAYTVGYLHTPFSRGTIPMNLRKFKRELIERYQGDIQEMNRALGTEFVNWNAFYVLPMDFLQRRNYPGDSPLEKTFRTFKQQLPEHARLYFSPEGFYKSAFLKNQYGRDIESYNRAAGTRYASWDQVHLDRRLPDEPGRTQQERKDWLEFVRTLLNLLWIRADESAAPAYRAFLETKHLDLKTVNRYYGTAYSSFAEIPLADTVPEGGMPLSDWEAFLQGWVDPETGHLHILPAEAIRIHSLEFQFRDFLKRKYGSLEELNRTLGPRPPLEDWLEILPPQRKLHYSAFEENILPLRWEFTIRNYIAVLDYILLHGRGIQNTVIYCTLAILSALLVNPFAAYALSRYRPPSTYKVLLFLMMTMAFPPMVTQIPMFLMLREFHMLNTFWALVLPGVAQGYSIFLLKGFFDSLPRELYESASIDGAGEFRIFWQITMSLSKPILAVIALQAFTMAYSNFMMALLICQDEKMWTLMPWLYQLQQRSGSGVIFSSLIIAALPTFLVFVFCQNIIMRGIVVPVEK